MSANRFLVQAGIFDSFVESLNNKMKALKIGNGMNNSVDLGPLINKVQAEKVK